MHLVSMQGTQLRCTDPIYDWVDTVYPSVSSLRGRTLLYVNYADVLNSDVSKYYNARSARSIHGGTGMHLMAWMSGMRLSL